MSDMLITAMKEQTTHTHTHTHTVAIASDTDDS